MFSSKTTANWPGLTETAKDNITEGHMFSACLTPSIPDFSTLWVLPEANW
jgi:hypothetical protein